MTTLTADEFATVAPSEADARLARESIRQLTAQKIGKRSTVRIQLVDGDKKSETIIVPSSALQLFMHLLSQMSEGNSVTVVQTHPELTTQQAADLLNVSRPYLNKLLDEGKIPSRMVGRYRRVRFDDLMAFKRKDDQARAKILDRLTAEAQELGMGY